MQVPFEPIDKCPSCGSKGIRVDVYDETADCDACGFSAGGANIWK